MARKELLQVYVEPEDFERLRALAGKTERPYSFHVRAALGTYLRIQETELARKAHPWRGKAVVR